MFVAVKKTGKNFRFRLDERLKDAWARMCSDKNIPQQSAIEAVLKLTLMQDDVAQSMLIGQLTPSEDLIEVVLRRMTDPAFVELADRYGVAAAIPPADRAAASGNNPRSRQPNAQAQEPEPAGSRGPRGTRKR